jgi:hypothetical protein
MRENIVSINSSAVLERSRKCGIVIILVVIIPFPTGLIWWGDYNPRQSANINGLNANGVGSTSSESCYKSNRICSGSSSSSALLFP